MPIIDMARADSARAESAQMFSGQKDIQASSQLKTGQLKQVRNRSETGQKHQKGSTCLASHPSSHPSIHPSTSALIIATSTITITTITTSPPPPPTTTTTSSTSTSIWGTSNDITLTITKIVPSLTARADFFEVEEDSGKGQKQVRNTKKAALA